MCAPTLWADSTVNIHAVQIDLPSSPYLGDTVTTIGIVVAVLSDGFYIENPDSEWDSNVCTAEGIYVYTPTGVPTNAVLENSVTVTGVVQASNSSDYAGTQIYISSPSTSNVVTNSTGNSLPSAVSASTMSSAIDGTCSLYSADTFGEWLPFEVMRVNVPSSSSLLVTQATGGTVTTEDETATTNGQFWAVFTDSDSSSDRPFRATGISELETVPSTAPSTVSRWSGNPQLLLVDTTTLGGTAINAAAGTLYTGSSNLVGIIDYHVSTLGYTGLLLTSSSVSSLTASNTVTATAASAAADGQITIAEQNLDELYDTSTVSSSAFSRRIAKLALAIVDEENSPDIIAVQEAQSLSALSALASQISSDGGPTYTVYWLAGNDSTGLTNGFLINETGRISLQSITQVGATSTWTSSSGTTSTLFGRPPLVLKVAISRGSSSSYDLTVINTELLDRTDIDSTSTGADVRSQRNAQAEYLSSLIESYQEDGEHVVIAGGFNSFQFSDGYVDTLGAIVGDPVSSSLVTLASSTTTSPELTNLTTLSANTSTNRYNYVENGSAEQTDHILTTSDLSSETSISYARFGADFPLVDLNDSTTPLYASSHDGVIALITIPYETTLKLTSSLNPSYYSESVTFTATASSSGDTPTGTVTFYDGSTELGTGTMSSGAATYTTSALTVGSHTITAEYGGDSSHESASASLTQVVESLLTSSNTLSCSPNPAAYGATVTCTATVSGPSSTPAGSVTFYDGTTSLGTATLDDGVATYSTSSLSVGSHSISAVYAGSAPYASSTSNTITEVITSTFSLSITPDSRTVYTGESPTYTVAVTPGSGFTLNVALACSGAPSNSTCTLSPSTVTGGSGSSKLTVVTNAPTQSAAGFVTWYKRGYLAIASGLFTLLLPWLSRRKAKRLMIVFLCAFLATASITGCGSSGTLTGGTPAGTYTITITGTAVDGSVTTTKTATTTLTVKSMF
ncbi:Ig-like domain repeat protein [Silvibacterium sp.]|uniref:Ig-like domain repeat protein n=1 Tax=Silvibacterium sp. TaxID=1964179 RepID=UPI0039E28276